MMNFKLDLSVEIISLVSYQMYWIAFWCKFYRNFNFLFTLLILMLALTSTLTIKFQILQ